jgi:thioredoxin-like negative regulator of GroEL
MCTSITHTNLSSSEQKSCGACSNISPLMLANNHTQNYKMVYSYSPQCGHCTKFMPVWNEFENSVSDNDILLEKVNCRENPERCVGIEGVPNVTLFKNGRKIQFDGERTVRGLLSFLSMN